MSERQIIPFHKPCVEQAEIDEVVDTLKSGWLTTGPKTKEFERRFAAYVGVKYAVALNSATAALHLALEALEIRRGDYVLVPTMTFAATAEVVRYFDAIPVLVDCCESDLNIDLLDARRKAEGVRKMGGRIHSIIPVHYGGSAADMSAVLALATEFGLKVIEDAAHCCPSYYRSSPGGDWCSVGSESSISCFSFYANKCITTGEGGMACTNDEALAERMRLMSLHGISKDAWKRFSADGSWRYEIIAPGYKYNMTDIAAALGLQQLRKADALRDARQWISDTYREMLAGFESIRLPPTPQNRIHSWHLFPIRIRLDLIKIDRGEVISRLRSLGVLTSVHWIPLHLHPYYKDLYNYKAADFPVASRISGELISLPIYPGLSGTSIEYIVAALRATCI